MLTEAYADDLTILFKWDRAGLKRIVEILEEFALVSGLQINVEKTQLMITGGDGERINSEIHGIKVVDKIGILGVEIDRRLDNLDMNWEKAMRKMVSKANYWNLFRLSIGGRAMVAKTYLISQLTYLMGAIPVDNETLGRANEIIIIIIFTKSKFLTTARKILLMTASLLYFLISFNSKIFIIKVKLGKLYFENQRIYISEN